MFLLAVRLYRRNEFLIGSEVKNRRSESFAVYILRSRWTDRSQHELTHPWFWRGTAMRFWWSNFFECDVSISLQNAFSFFTFSRHTDIEEVFRAMHSRIIPSWCGFRSTRKQGSSYSVSFIILVIDPDYKRQEKEKHRFDYWVFWWKETLAQGMWIPWLAFGTREGEGIGVR
jgi:hypothetical protein